MNKDFSVKDFSLEYEKYSTKDDKEKFIKNNLKCESYMPYAEKLLIAENIVKSSSYALIKDGDNLKKSSKIEINTPMRYILFVMTVINKYTNIEVDFNNAVSEFDYVNKNGLIEIIFNKIGDKEISEFNTVIEMVLDDFMTNKYQFKNYIDDMLLKVSGLVERCAPLIDNITSKLDSMSEEDVERLTNKLGKFFNK